MSTTTKTAAKRVAKKTETPAPAATPATAPAAAAAAPAKAAVAPAKAVAPAPVAPAPEASAVANSAPALPTTTVGQDIDTLISQTQAVRDSAVNTLKALQKLQKRVAREVKEAGRRRRRNRKAEEGAEGATKEKRPTIFTTPVTLKDELCAFLGKPKGTQMTPADVTRAFSAYVESHKLKDAEKGHTIHPDAAMRKVLGVKEGEPITYRNIQRYLYKLYVLPEKKKSSQ